MRHGIALDEHGHFDDDGFYFCDLHGLGSLFVLIVGKK
jgi:hypothetical protein